MRRQVPPAAPSRTCLACYQLVLECVCDPQPAAPSPEQESGDLSFAALRAVNVVRCVSGFGHTLESWSVAEWTNAAAGEMGEACNIAKKMLRHRDGVAGNKGADLDLDALRKKLARELADAIIYADLVAASQGIDLGETIRETFNAKSEEIGARQRL